METQSGELLLVYSTCAYEIQGEQTPWKGAKRPPGRWDVEENQNVKVENKCSEIGPVMDDSKSIIPNVTLEKRMQMRKFSLTVCAKKYY